MKQNKSLNALMAVWNTLTRAPWGYNNGCMGFNPPDPFADRSKQNKNVSGTAVGFSDPSFGKGNFNVLIQN